MYYWPHPPSDASSRKGLQVTRGADRAEMLRFASKFTEFGGWVFQDAGDLMRAIGEAIASARDSDEAVIEAIAGEKQDERSRSLLHSYLRGNGGWSVLGSSWAP